MLTRRRIILIVLMMAFSLSGKGQIKRVFLSTDPTFPEIDSLTRVNSNKFVEESQSFYEPINPHRYYYYSFLSYIDSIDQVKLQSSTDSIYYIRFGFYVNGQKCYIHRSTFKLKIDRETSSLELISPKQTLLLKGKYVSLSPFIWNDTLTNYYENGNRKKVIIFKIGKVQSSTDYSIDGQQQLIEGFSYDLSSIDSSNFEQISSFNQNKIIERVHLNYNPPDKISEIGAYGTIYFQLIIKADGKIESLKILRGSHPYIDNIAFDIINNIDSLKPFTKNNKPIDSYFYTNIKFTLSH